MEFFLQLHSGTLQQYDASESWIYKTAPNESNRAVRAFFTKNFIFILSASE